MWWKIAWDIIPFKILMKNREYDLFMISVQIAFIIYLFVIGIPMPLFILCLWLNLYSLFRTLRRIRNDLYYIWLTFLQFCIENESAPVKEIREKVIKDFEEKIAIWHKRQEPWNNFFTVSIVVLLLIVIFIRFFHMLTQ